MHNTLASAIEFGIKQIAKRNLAEEEYQVLVLNIRKSKMIRVGNEHKTLHDVIVEQAIDIANWATNNGYSEISDEVEKKKKKAIDNIKAIFDWS